MTIGDGFVLSNGAQVHATKKEIGDGVEIGEGVTIVCDELVLGNNVTIGAGTVLKGSRIIIGEQSTIMEYNHLVASDVFRLGRCSTFGRNCRAVCRVIEIGDFYHGGSDIDFGGGGRLGPNSIFQMGHYGFLGDRSIVNTSDTITIGDDVGIGAEVMLWTHGAYLSVLDGFPADFAPVTIGSHVWIPARSVVLPGVTIGSNVVISIGSLVNRNVPDGALVGGIPAKVLRENAYPKDLSQTQKDAIVRQILVDYIALLQYKGYTDVVEQNIGDTWSLLINDTHQLLYSVDESSLLPLIDPNRETILLYFKSANSESLCEGIISFNLSNLQIDGDINEFGEDLRDYLRRKGIKFYTNQKFMSITPPAFRRWL